MLDGFYSGIHPYRPGVGVIPIFFKLNPFGTMSIGRSGYNVVATRVVGPKGHG